MWHFPSINAIRGELGNTCSKGTIYRYLREIEEEEGGSTGTQVAVSYTIQDLSARQAGRQAGNSFSDFLDNDSKSFC